MRLAPEHPALRFDGAISVEIGDGFVRPWRVPFERWTSFPWLATLPLEVGELPTTPGHLAAMAAGIRLTFRTDSTVISFNANPTTPAPQLVVDGQYAGDGLAFTDLGGGVKTCELWLGQFSDFALRGIDLDDDALIEPLPDTRPRWLTYGSSITHGSNATTPLNAWPTVVARGQNLNLINLGMGGNCCLEVNIARLIRDTPADFITLCLGINLHGDRRLTADTLPSAIAGMVEIIREKHPTTPMTLIGPISSPPREDEVGGCGMTLEQLREQVRESAALLGERYVDGRDLIGPDDMDGMPDLLHPDDKGNAVLAERFVEKVLTPMREPWRVHASEPRGARVELLAPAAARNLRTHGTDPITLSIGSEIWRTAALNLRTLRPAVIGFIELIREGQPTTSIEIELPSGGDEPNASGLSLDAVRLEIEAAVAMLQDAGDRHVSVTSPHALAD